MDHDPELDVTLSNGRQVVRYQIRSVSWDLWVVDAPGAIRHVVRGDAALAARQYVDARIAAHLAAGWVPADAQNDVPSVEAIPLPPDLALQISSLLEALARARPALRAADPTGQLCTAYHRFRQQAWRVGVGAPRARFARARQERRLGELAEQAGNLPAAILHYRAALASHTRVGVKRRLQRLAPDGASRGRRR